MNSLKVKLQKPRPYTWKGDDWTIMEIHKALPFYKSRMKTGKYHHRVRSGHLFTFKGKTHAGFKMWCGNTFTVPRHGSLTAKLPPDAVMCATCEGRAIGAGQDGAQVINGRPVMYSPRRKACG